MTVEVMGEDYLRHNPGQDPLELRIRGLIRDHVYSKGKGKEMLDKAKAQEVDYLKDCIGNIDDSKSIHNRTQQVLKELATSTNSKIVEGEENLAKISANGHVFALVNHFSAYKLIAIDQEEVGTNIPEVNELYLPPMFYASIWPVAEKLGRPLYEAHLKLPGPLKKIQEAAGTLIFPNPGKDGGQFSVVLERTKNHIENHPNGLSVIFPEGGSSGKRNNGGPFDLEHFHGGPISIASELGVTILPVAQYFDPEKGFELRVFEPFTPSPGIAREKASELADKTRKQMQAWLDTKKSS